MNIKFQSMKKSLLIISIFISNLLIAQTKLTVTVANFSFTPASFTIAVGDTVEFVNVSGFHSIDGNQTTFPGNPVAFGNALGTGWTYTEVFNVPGEYNYRCGAHQTSMLGDFIVEAPLSVLDQEALNNVGFYPNPASGRLNFSKIKAINSVTIYSLSGKQVFASNIVTKSMDVSMLNPGVYFIKVKAEGKEISKKLIIQ